MSTASTTAVPSSRLHKLRKRFKEVLTGTSQVRSSREAKVFLEALDGHETSTECAEELVASVHGVESLRASVRLDVSDVFIQEHSIRVIPFIANPEIQPLAGGLIQSKLLLATMKPPTFWNPLVNLFVNHKLDMQYHESFARLIYQVTAHPEFSDDVFTSRIEAIVQSGILGRSESPEVRDLSRKVERMLRLKLEGMPAEESFSCGGRHDNDFSDYRKIAIYPTPDEFRATTKPFLRRAEEVFAMEGSARVKAHLDNQFRLLREDMLGEIRNELQICLGQKRGRRSATILGPLMVVGLRLGDDKRSRKSLVSVVCRDGIPELRGMNMDKRKKYLARNTWFLKHQAFGVLLRKDDVCGFASLERDEDSISNDTLQLRFADNQSFGRALTAFKRPESIQFVLVNAPVFAYQPILEQLKTIDNFPLEDILVGNPHDATHPSMTAGTSSALQVLAESLLASKSPAAILRNGGIKVVSLDQSQTRAIAKSISQRATLIHGPPGTGKSFIGSLVAMIIYKFTKLKVLVMSFTNHATDQFITDLCKIGIQESDIVRLGSKHSEETASMSLFNRRGPYRRSQASWSVIDDLKNQQNCLRETILPAFDHYIRYNASFELIMEYLEFSDNDGHFFDAFSIPSESHSWRRAGKKGKAIRPDYLWQRWISGEGPGVLTDSVPKHAEAVWDMNMSSRRQHIDKWLHILSKERVEAVQDLVDEYDRNQADLDDLFKEDKAEAISSARIIACTTTGASIYATQIQKARPDFVIYEEAGEILEAHTLTSLGASAKQSVCIGDHKQLRPKVNNYALTVESGNGYNLNMSMFERLILQGFPHTSLKAQHRMHPDISEFSRALTYPDLLDDPKTAARATVRGLQDRVVFINHEHPETHMAAIIDRRDPNQKGSKENDFESFMILKIVRYLAQQGYGSGDIVVLTPYLGQLRLLRDRLQEENDPILNDIDSASLNQAGLLTTAASKVKKRSLRLATIDNYQGEESDIVIASLTRSNDRGDIGFMSSPERLNVLITRARNCLILVGNMDTFQKSKAREVWCKFFELLKKRNHLYDGLPVVCDRHPERKTVLTEPSDFDKVCPDGGCGERCGGMLSCNLHACTRRCHRVSDHSQIHCTQIIERSCERGHATKIKCCEKNELCRICLKEDAEKERKRKQQEEMVKRDLELERQRLQRQEAYRHKLKEVDDAISYGRRQMQYMDEEEEQKKTLAQKQKDLQDLRKTHERLKLMKKKQKEQLRTSQIHTVAESSRPSVDLAGENGSAIQPAGSAQAEWTHLKQFSGAQSEELDELMGMTGLETVKEEFLSIKNTVDTKLRQNVSLASQRFSCTLLGNPGTGKTTVARLYAKFLTSIGIIPGSRFEETTGSKLANKGVSGCEKLVQSILNDGGGVLFIDEAYQMTSGNSMGGAAVLDYLLAEVENLTGKVVFVLAGYNKQMESFFAHNPGLPSRFPVEMKFDDYNDEELRLILALKIRKEYKGRMQCEDGFDGLYCRIVARRIGRGRGREGFGNARTVENTLAVISKRQSTRIARARKSGQQPDDLLLTKEDLIGPEPKAALSKSTGWQKLSLLTGLGSVKQAVRALVDCIQQNYQRELAEESLIEFSLNKVFLGNPGTGKTTVAKIYGQILVDLGLLSKGEVIVKNPSDFVGGALGQSEQQTKGILAASQGKVLVIDEAYALYGGGTSQGAQGDPYKTAVIDTIVAEVQNVPGDDRCVLLLGYRDQLEIMFQNVNPGLTRRFPIASGFVFEDFTDDELRAILDQKLQSQSYTATGQAKDVAMEILRRARNRPNFGNAGEIDIILNDAKARHQSRWAKGEAKSAELLEAIDFDEDFDRAEHAVTNIKQLFRGTVGSEEIVATFENIQQTVQASRNLEMDPKESIPFNFIFKGPPGTGKTTTARKIGKIYYDLGFLATAKVEECSATDIIGQYVGQTGPKVQQMLDKALGNVLFIDEAYRLAEGHYAKEAIDEIVDAITKEKYHKKLVIVLAGYEADIDRLMTVNEGLTSRFPEVLIFRSLSPAECVVLLIQTLATRRTSLEKKSNELVLDALESPSDGFQNRMNNSFSQLSALPNWANARDVVNLAKSMFNRALLAEGAASSRRLVVTETIVLSELSELYKKRQVVKKSEDQSLLELCRMAQQPSQHHMQRNRAKPVLSTSRTTTTHTTTLASSQEEEAKQEVVDNNISGSEEPPHPCDRDQPKIKRDAGVSDAVWAQLLQDQRAEEEKEEEYKRLLEAKERADDEAEYEKIVKRLVEEEERRKKEQAEKERLARMGVCPAGYAWIKQAGGYRCAGGSHYITNERLCGMSS